MLEVHKCGSFNEPQYWEYLTTDDKKEYIELKERISQLFNNSNKERFSSAFIKAARLIEVYIERESGGNKYRDLVCGFFKVDGRLAVNTRQLISLVEKCKSSINSGLQALGYKVIQMDADCSMVLMKTYPFLKNNISLTRQWTLREPIAVNKQNSNLPILGKITNVLPTNENLTPLFPEFTAPSLRKECNFDIIFETDSFQDLGFPFEMIQEDYFEFSL